MTKPGIDTSLFATIKDQKGRLYIFEISKNPLYEEADDEVQYVCHPILADQQGTIIPYLSYKAFLKKKDFRIISRE